MLGAPIAVLWVFCEWLRYHGQRTPMIGYNDTIFDLLLGCVGSLVAGIGLACSATAKWDTPRI